MKRAPKSRASARHAAATSARQSPDAAPKADAQPPATANPYDVMPYPDLTYAQTHPDRLATLGSLLGLAAAPPDACRVLELGCAAGGNLLPMALNLPHSHFVGIDYAAQQIALGEQRIATLDVPNLELHCMDITDQRATRKLTGSFDYIIAHGLYSWVAKPVRDALLQIIRRLLAPNGVAYVSYNTLPGWNINRIVRDAMLFHTRTAEDPQETAHLAREMVAFLATHVPDNYEAYRAIFQRYQSMLQEGMKGANEAFFLHDELEVVNEPVYFQDFVAHVGEFGLQYFVEAELASVLPHLFGPEVAQKLQKMATTPIELEQYMDFLRNRMFRQSLLCHAEATPTRLLRPEPLIACYLRSEAEPETPLRLDADGKVQTGQGVISFRAPDGTTLTTDHPLSHAAFQVLRQTWPRALTFDELFTAAYARLGDGAPALTDTRIIGQEKFVLAGNLLRGHGHSNRLVGLHKMAPAIAVTPGKRPQAAPVARFEAGNRSAVTNLWHERVQLDEPKRQLLLLLDGTKSADQIEQIWRVALNHTLGRTGTADARQKLDKLDFKEEMAWLARAALLIQ